MSGTPTIERLYTALAASDGAAMAACYAPGATFQDPAFGRLEGPRVAGMWNMLTSRSTGVTIDLRQAVATDAPGGGTGTANWVATYRFGPQQRRVVNDVRAAFVFAPDGLILEHIDRFDLAAWAAQAMGRGPALLGRTPLLGLVVRRTTRRQLDAYLTADTT